VIILLVAIALITGILAGLLGIGGGMVLVPTLLWYGYETYGSQPWIIHVAIGTSLSTIIPTSISSALAHFRKNSLSPELLKRLALPTLAGAFAGGVLTSVIPGRPLKLTFAVLMVYLGIRMFKKKPGVDASAPLLPHAEDTKLDMRKCVGTSSGLGTLVAIPGTIGHLVAGYSNPDLPPETIGHVHWMASLLIIPGTVTGAQIGARLAHKIPRELLRKIFGAVLLIAAFKTMTSSL
jgi:uncharacterized membrane protein YfcA